MTENFDAAGKDASLNCFECGKEILGGAWFARIRLGSQRIVFCRPGCVETFLDQVEEVTPSSRLHSDRSFRRVTYAKNAKELPKDGEQVFSRNLHWLHESQSLTKCLPEAAAQEVCSGNGD